jgi:hypothetical protein
MAARKAGGIADWGGGGKIRLSGGQGDDIAPFGAQPRGSFGDRDDGRKFDGADAFGAPEAVT